MNSDEQYMRLAIELAKKGEGAVNPNPLVGAVIVKNGKIIGEGYHAKYGDLHAERSAFANLKEDATGATMYVTLEPCCHYGKQPPCVEAIVEHGIKKVYVGSDDPNVLVAGNGIKYLMDRGIDVQTGFLKDECDALNPVFFKYITKRIPYILMKYAMTMDGKIAAYTGESKWISNEQSRLMVQQLRNKMTGIMVGIGTVLTDNPMLSCRIENGRNPVRIVCDTNLRIPIDCNLVNTASDIKTIVCYGEFDDDKKLNIIAKTTKLEILKAKNVVALPVAKKDGKLDIEEMLKKLGELQIDGILLEGGGTLNYSFIEKDLIDEVHVFIAPKILGGATAKTPVSGKGFEKPSMGEKYSLQDCRTINEDVLLIYKHKE